MKRIKLKINNWKIFGFLLLFGIMSCNDDEKSITFLSHKQKYTDSSAYLDFVKLDSVRYLLDNCFECKRFLYDEDTMYTKPVLYSIGIVKINGIYYLKYEKPNPNNNVCYFFSIYKGEVLYSYKTSDLIGDMNLYYTKDFVYYSFTSENWLFRDKDFDYKQVLFVQNKNNPYHFSEFSFENQSCEKILQEKNKLIIYTYDVEKSIFWFGYLTQLIQTKLPSREYILTDISHKYEINSLGTMKKIY